MEYKDNQILEAQDLSFIGVLHDRKKSKNALQPIFECFTNAIEAIKIKQESDKEFKGEITIKIYATELTDQNTEFSQLSIIDNGVGFNDEQFKRFNKFKDISKGYKNLGSGRIQYVHYFNRTHIKSVFEHEGKFYDREFIVSKQDELLKHNAIVKHIHCKKTESSNSETTITFGDLLENSAIYNALNETTLKDKLLERYVHYFCYNRTKLPNIKIEFYIHKEFKGETTISDIDIPSADKAKTTPLNYSKRTRSGIEKIDKTENFTIDAFKIPGKLLKENKLNLVSKGEVCEESGIHLESLASTDNINGCKYLFLVSSDYIDRKDTNVRGELNIPSRDSFEKDLFANDEDILIEDIQKDVNSTISGMYPEIDKVKEKHREDFAKLKEMFLLDDKTANEINISINDSDSKILEKFYEIEAKKNASFDASVKESVDNLDKLDPTSPTYQDELKTAVEELVRTIPLQNSRALTHYVARRKLVLKLFQKILNSETEKLINGGRIDEDVLHNLIFQQSSKDTLNSDLWLVNEEYIYFRGVSEGLLGQIEIDGTKILKENLSEEEQEYRTKQGGDARLKRTDILLFPAEAKCIIIELKAPEENISEHLNQINRYASLINNLSLDTLKFNTFYGYLIGESIDADDIIDNDSDFIKAPNLEYIFRPYKKINGKFGRENGSLYTEIIKYSTLLERAKLRNQIFIDTLTLTSSK